MGNINIIPINTPKNIESIFLTIIYISNKLFYFSGNVIYEYEIVDQYTYK